MRGSTIKLEPLVKCSPYFLFYKTARRKNPFTIQSNKSSNAVCKQTASFRGMWRVQRWLLEYGDKQVMWQKSGVWLQLIPAGQQRDRFDLLASPANRLLIGFVKAEDGCTDQQPYSQESCICLRSAGLEINGTSP